MPPWNARDFPTCNAEGWCPRHLDHTSWEHPPELVRNKSSSHNVKSDTGAQQREVVIPHVGNLSYLNHDMSHREGSNSISDDWSETRLLTNKHSTRKVFMENGESFVYWRKCHAKVWRASWKSYIVALCSLCRALLFSLDSLEGYTVLDCYEVMMLT